MRSIQRGGRLSDWFEEVIKKIQSISSKIDSYKESSVIQSLPSVAYVNRAKKCLEEGRLKDALDILSEAESLPQEDALVYKYKGIVYDKLFRFTDSVIAYKKSANLDKNDKTIWKYLGFALLNSGIYDEADESFENADKLTPANSEVLMGWGMSLMKQKKYPEAREKFADSAKANKYNLNAIFLGAVTEIKLKMYDEAESKLKFLANVAPNEGNSFEYAKLLFLKKDYESALFYAAKALDFNKNMLPAYLLTGEIYRIKNEESASLQNYETAESLSLIAPNLYIEWAFSLIKFEHMEQALEKIQKAEELDCNNKEVHLIKTYLSVISGNLEGAKEVFEEAVNSSEENKSFALTGLGLLYCAEENFIEGIHCFKSALKEDLPDSINNYYIAKAYMHLGDNTNAREYFETAIKENPRRLRTYIDYSKLLISIDNMSDAARKLRKAVKYAPDNTELLNMLFFTSYILVKENVCEYNIKEALELADKIKSIDENAFKYPDKSAELAEMLNKLQEKENN